MVEELSKNDLIDSLIDHTGIDPYKLKRLSKAELEQLNNAYENLVEGKKEAEAEIDRVIDDFIGSKARIFPFGDTEDKEDLYAKKLQKEFDDKMNKRLLERTFYEPSERLEIILDTQEELIAQQEEALKEENYLSPRERQDRKMNLDFMALVEYLWKRITGLPYKSDSFLGLAFAFLVMATIFALVYLLIIMPIVYLIMYVWDLLFNTLPK